MTTELLTPQTEMPSLVLHFGEYMRRMTDDEYFEFCRANPDLRIERTTEGDIIIVPPTGGRASNRQFTLTGLFGTWVEQDGTGVGFNSSTEFRLPNGANRSPDLAWITRERWNRLTEDEQEKFPPLCPDFIVELRSRTDSLADLQAKVEEYIANGARLGWLIDPYQRVGYIYRPDREVERLDDPATLGGESVLKNFVLPLERIWK